MRTIQPPSQLSRRPSLKIDRPRTARAKPVNLATDIHPLSCAGAADLGYKEPTIATLLGHKPTGAVPACASRVAVQRADTDSCIAHLDVWTMAA